MKPWHRAVQDAFGVLTGTLEETAGNSGTERESAADGQKKMPERKITITDYDLWEKESLKSEENPTAPYHATEKSVLRVYSEDGDGNNTDTGIGQAAWRLYGLPCKSYRDIV